MASRNFNYDTLGIQFQHLAKVIVSERKLYTDFFKKANDSTPLHINVKGFVDSGSKLTSEAELISKTINASFDICKSDFETGKLQLTRYRTYLQSIADFFNTDVKVKDLPKDLKAKEMLVEIKRFL